MKWIAVLHANTNHGIKLQIMERKICCASTRTVALARRIK